MHHDRRRAGSFGSAAEQYDRARPSYPDELIDDLAGGAIGGRRLRVLDVGCGTGIAARLFARRGCDVVGVEQDPRMAEVAEVHGLAVEVARFEAWDPRGRTFDLVTAAQSWHWVDPTIGPAKAGGVLEPGGRLAVFWNNYTHEPAALAAFQEIYGRLAPEMAAGSVALGTIPPAQVAEARAADAAALEACGLFEAPERATYAWSRTYSAEEWLAELPTHSGHATLPPDTLAAVLDAMATAVGDLGGRVVVAYETQLLSARRR